jgi:hypothetical protein
VVEDAKTRAPTSFMVIMERRAYTLAKSCPWPFVFALTN